MELLIVLSLARFFQEWFVEATLEEAEDFFTCEKVAGEELGKR